MGQLRSHFTRDDAGVGKEDDRFQDKDRLIAQGAPFQLVAVSRAEGRETWRGEAAGTGVMRHHTLNELVVQNARYGRLSQC